MSNESLKEYLELIEKAEKESAQKVDSPVKKKSRSVDEFIKQFNITAGLKRIHNYVIYFYYRQKFHHSSKLSKIQFFREFSKLFPRARVGSQRYYLLNENVFPLNREVKAEAKQYEKDYTIRYKARKGKSSNEKDTKKENNQEHNQTTRTEGSNESES
jgi:hypothetical protein